MGRAAGRTAPATTPTFKRTEEIVTLESAITMQIANAVIAEVRERLDDAPARISPRYLTYEQAGEYVGKTAAAMRIMVSRKEIPAIHAGPRTVRIDKQDLDSWAARRRY
jgi:excisionase family DNA binding protein